ncbi:Lipid/polyisoprenoid-binding YceI-like domain-containing protein [Comamonas aquatilis]|uniref:YceI family protein n=1 Tax=Comamonas aquatilis TaxID=1778406 RepID=UPI0039EFF0CC
MKYLTKYRLSLRMPLAAAVTALIAALMSACAQPDLEPSPPSLSIHAPADFPAAAYAQAAAQGQRVLRVDSRSSRVVITVRRGGTLAKLGHDHVVAAQELQGLVAPELGRADIYLALDSLSVDDSDLRAQAGFDTQPGSADIAATRANMLGKVLQTQQFPFALIQVSSAATLASNALLAVDITLHGVRRSFSVPARVESKGKGLQVSGMLAFDQSSFGITPFSILGGAIQVQDRLELHFDVQALESAGRSRLP